ncbi:MAG: Spo0B domain-containing protein [Negativicutes bacterium]|nr:Spo0B domain-containing protein [Negativicutes bacterium]
MPYAAGRNLHREREVSFIADTEVVHMAREEVCPELARLLRVQRHDFINHAQVIHAFLQLGKTERAMHYIEELCRDPEVLCAALHYHVPQPGCVLKAGGA